MGLMKGVLSRGWALRNEGRRRKRETSPTPYGGEQREELKRRRFLRGGEKGLASGGKGGRTFFFEGDGDFQGKGKGRGLIRWLGKGGGVRIMLMASGGGVDWFAVCGKKERTCSRNFRKEKIVDRMRCPMKSD